MWVQAYDPSHFPVKPFPAGLTHLQLWFATDKATHFKSGPWEAPSLMPHVAPLTGLTCLVLANIAIFEIPEELFQLSALQVRADCCSQVPQLGQKRHFQSLSDWQHRP